MSISYNSSIVRDGLVLHLDPANPKTRLGPNLIPSRGSLSDFPANQNVTVTQNGRYIQAVTNQVTSSPGVWPISNQWITVSANTQYTFRALASVAAGSTAWLYVSGNVNGNLVWQGTALTTSHQWIESTFDSGSNTSLKVGILWSSPSMSSTIFIEDVGLHKTSTSYDLIGNNTITANNLSPYSDTVYNLNNTQSATLICPDSTAMKPANVTVTAWVYMITFNPLNDFDGTYPTILWKCNDGNSGGAASYGLSLAAGNGAPRFTIAPTQLISTTPITMGVWTMLTGVYNGSTMKLYKNDTLDISAAAPTNITYSTQVVSVGTRVFNGAYQYPWNGKIGVVKVYNRALSSAEVSRNFNAYRDRYGI